MSEEVRNPIDGQMTLLERCREVALIQTQVIEKIQSVMEAFKITFKEEQKVVDGLCNYLKDDLELKSLIAEFNNANNVATKQALPSCKRRKAHVSQEDEASTELSQISEITDFCLSKLDDLESLKSVLEKRKVAAAINLLNVKKLEAAKHKSLTNFARRNCSSEAQRLPGEMLKMIFSNLDTNDLITVGQVCQRWRQVSRQDESLWSARKLDLPPHTHQSHRILKAAPYIGMVRLYEKNLNLVQKSKCKVFGLNTGNLNSPVYDKTIHAILKKNSAHLKVLVLRTISKTIARTMNELHLRELHLAFISSVRCGSGLSFSMNSLEKLVVSGFASTSVVVSLIKSCNDSLRELDLFSSDARSHSCHRHEKEDQRIVSALLQCSNLQELKMCFCYTSFNMESPTFKAESVMLIMPSLCSLYDGDSPCTASMFAAGSVSRLSFHHNATRRSMEAAVRFISRIPKSTLVALNSVQFHSELTPRPSIAKMISCSLQAIPEIKDKWTMTSTNTDDENIEYAPLSDEDASSDSWQAEDGTDEDLSDDDQFFDADPDGVQLDPCYVS